MKPFDPLALLDEVKSNTILQTTRAYRAHARGHCAATAFLYLRKDCMKCGCHKETTEQPGFVIWTGTNEIDQRSQRAVTHRK
jgi:hypothetical protein